MWLLSFVLLALFLIQNFYFVFFEARGRGTTRKAPYRHPGDGRARRAAHDGRRRRSQPASQPRGLPAAGAMVAPEPLCGRARVGTDARARVDVRPGRYAALQSAPTPGRRHRRGDAGRRRAAARAAARYRGAGRRWAEAETAPYVFTAAQLSVYGMDELQVLEDVLRGDVRTPERRQTRAAVADRIAQKLDWGAPVPAGRPPPSSGSSTRPFARTSRRSCSSGSARRTSSASRGELGRGTLTRRPVRDPRRRRPPWRASDRDRRRQRTRRGRWLRPR